MEAIVLQNWVTLKGLEYGAVAQSEPAWLSAQDIEDLVIVSEIKEATGLPYISYETAPAPEESLFYPIFQIEVLTGVRSDAVLAKYMAVPVAAYVRWRIIGRGFLWSATFRVSLSADRVR